jgi:hypothetical protein
VTFFEKALGFSWPFWNVCSLRCLGQAIPGWVQVCVQTCLEPVVVAHTGHQRGEEDEAGGSRVRGQPGLHLKKKNAWNQGELGDCLPSSSSPSHLLRPRYMLATVALFHPSVHPSFLGSSLTRCLNPRQRLSGKVQRGSPWRTWPGC